MLTYVSNKKFLSLYMFELFYVSNVCHLFLKKKKKICVSLISSINRASRVLLFFHRSSFACDSFFFFFSFSFLGSSLHLDLSVFDYVPLSFTKFGCFVFWVFNISTTFYSFHLHWNSYCFSSFWSLFLLNSCMFKAFAFWDFKKYGRIFVL